MAPSKGKKKARTPRIQIDNGRDGEQTDEIVLPKNTRITRSRSNKDAGGDNWDSWQDSVRAQEVDRVKQYVGSFQKQLQDTKAKAVQSLREAEEKRLKTENAYLNKVREEYGEDLKLSPNAAKSKDTAELHMSHPLYTAGREIFGLLHDILARYDQANTELTSVQEQHAKAIPDAAAWEKDRSEARTVLRYGRAYADSLVRQIIVPGDQNEVDNIGHNLSQTGKSAIGMFPRSRAVVEGGETWGETARTQVQALTGLAQTIPANIEVDGMESSAGKRSGGGGHKNVSFVDQ